MQNFWTSILEKIYSFLFRKREAPGLAVPTEADLIVMELHNTVDKLNRSWNNFFYAADDFVEIAIMEIYYTEMEHGILYNKLRHLSGRRGPNESFTVCRRDYLPWLKNDPGSMKKV
jgi:hypothetical protein